jgi:anti-anti-sigma factor
MLPWKSSGPSAHAGLAALSTRCKGASVIAAEFKVSLHGASTFFLAGELDVGTAPLLNETIRAAVARGGPITLDLSNMTFIDSAGVHAILNAVAHLPSGCLILHGVDNTTQRILDNLGIGQAPNLHIIPCEKDLERDGWTVGLVEPSTLAGERRGG